MSRPLSPSTSKPTRSGSGNGWSTHGATAGGFDFVGQSQRRDGPIRYIRSVGERIDGSGDHPSHIVGVFRDIAEEWAQRHQMRIARALANTAEGVIVTDPAGRLIWCNGARQRLSRYSFDEIQGRKPGDFLQGPDSDAKTVAYMAQQLAAKKGLHRRDPQLPPPRAAAPAPAVRSS